METGKLISLIRTALLLAGSAFCIYSCGRAVEQEEDNFEGLMTQKTENLKVIESENGKLSYRFQAPLMEVYEYDREPFREFRKGIKVEKFSADSVNTIGMTLIGDYCINYIDRQLYEVKGNVVATNAEGQTLETQQLFWNQRTGRIYSNVDSKLTQGNDVIIGVGFESDEQFDDWEFRRPRGTLEVDVDSARSGGTEEDEEELSVRIREEGGIISDPEETTVEEPEVYPDDAASGSGQEGPAGMGEGMPAEITQSSAEVVETE